jgi:hypothetical protein
VAIQRYTYYTEIVEVNFDFERNYDIWMQYCVVLEAALRAIFHADTLTY